MMHLLSLMTVLILMGGVASRVSLELEVTCNNRKEEYYFI